MKKDKADINKMASSSETPKAPEFETNDDDVNDVINGVTMLLLLHLIFSEWAVDSIPSYKRNNHGSEPAIINFSYSDDKNSSANEIIYYNAIALLQKKYCKDNGQDDKAHLNDLLMFLSKECSNYMHKSSRGKKTLQFNDLADGMVYYPYLPQKRSKSADAKTIFSNEISYGRYTAEILTVLTGISYTTQYINSENEKIEFKDKIIECDAALLTLLAYYYWYTKSKKEKVEKTNLRSSNITADFSLLSFYYDNPWSIIDQLIFTVRRTYSKEISTQIGGKNKVTMSLFTCLEKYNELLTCLEEYNGLLTNNSTEWENILDNKIKDYQIFTENNPYLKKNYNQIVGINIAVYHIYKYLRDLIKSGDFPSVNLYDRKCGYHKYLPKIISQFLLMVYVEKKGFDGLKKNKQLPDGLNLNHPFIAKGNSYSTTHPQNKTSRSNFYNYKLNYDIMDTVLGKYDPIYYEVTMRALKKGKDISHKGSDKFIDQAEKIAQTIAEDERFANRKDKIFDREKYRIFYQNYFFKFNNIISTAYFLNDNILNSEAQKAHIREALDSQDKTRTRKALWNLIGLYGHYINNYCQCCNYLVTYDTRKAWEYNPEGCNHGCSTGKILSEIEGALYDLYSMFDFSDDNDALC